MLMPGIDAQALAPHLEAIRQQIASLPEHERRSLMQRVNSDRMRANDMRHAEMANRFDREMSRPRDEPARGPATDAARGGSVTAMGAILTALRLAETALDACDDVHGEDEVREARRALVTALPMAEAMANPGGVYPSWPAEYGLQISRIAEELIHASGKWPHTPDTEQALRLAVARAIGAMQTIRTQQIEAYPRHVGRRLL